MTIFFEWVDKFIDAAENLTYRNWEYHVIVENNVPYLQIQFDDHGTQQYCRKWLLYPTMNVSEFVRTAWMATLAAEEHEARENFRYRGRKIFAPHFDVDKLAEFAKKKDNLALTEDPK